MFSNGLGLTCLLVALGRLLGVHMKLSHLVRQICRIYLGGNTLLEDARILVRMSRWVMKRRDGRTHTLIDDHHGLQKSALCTGTKMRARSEQVRENCPG